MSFALDSSLRSVSAPSSDAEKIPDCVHRLRTCFESGLTRPIHWRRDQLRRLRSLIHDYAHELVTALASDLGKPGPEASSMDLNPVIREATHALRSLTRWNRPEHVRVGPSASRLKLVPEPLGVVLILAPWNSPVARLLSPLVGAIAAGNCALLVPSSETPRTSAVLIQRLRECLDSSAFAVVEGGVDETHALLKQRFDHIVYTGGAHLGRVVMQAASTHLTPVTLGVSGSSPCIVDRDADVKVAARRIAWAKFVNAGQTSVAPDYVLVNDNRQWELIRELGVALEQLYGSDPAASSGYGRIVSAAHHKRLVQFLADGTIARGGRYDAASRYLEPTLLTNVSSDAPVMQEEIFGPVLPIRSVRSTQEAIDFVNERERPFALYVFSSDEEVQQTLVETTSSASVSINGALPHSVRASAFRGFGESRFGVVRGKAAFDAFTYYKPVMKRSLRFDPSRWVWAHGDRRLRWLARF